MPTVIDVGRSLKLVAGLDNLGNAIVRRLTTDGLFYDQSYGVDVRRWLSAGMDQAKLAELDGVIRGQVEADPRVQNATVVVDTNIAAATMKISIDIDTAAGPFKLILAVTALTVDLLQVEALSA